MKQVKFQDKSIAYTINGLGRAVVLIHGFGVNRSIWEKLEEGLAEEYTVVIPDLPGINFSDRLDKGSMELYADAMFEIVHAEKLEKPVIIGHSMGGYITLALMEKHPDLASGFGLFHSSALADNEEKKAVRQKTATFIENHGSKAYMETAAANFVGDEESEQELLAQVLKIASDFTPETMIQQTLAMMERPDRTDVLSSSKVPVLFIIGEDDKLMPKDVLLEQVSLPEKSQVTILKESGHLGMLEESEKSIEAMKQFLNFTEISIN